MNALVVYDSWFGNTEKIAEVIAAGVGNGTRAVKVEENPDELLDDCDLLIVGSPTHGGVAAPGMQKFLNGLKSGTLMGTAVAAFDTRARYRWLKFIGFAAQRIARQLQQKGGILVVPPEGFYVNGREGPLGDGEVERARQWAVRLAEQIKGVPV